MTGRPAETWRKFSFSTPPAWAYALLALWCLGLLGIIASMVVIGAVSMRASGHLPLTRSSRRIANLATWTPSALILASISVMTLVVVAAFANVDASDANAGSVAGAVFLLATCAFIAGMVVRLLVAPFILPRARVEEISPSLDRVVELRNVNPAFIAATSQMYTERSAQSPASK